MQIEIGDLKTFYAERTGRVVRRIIRAHIQDLWPDCKSMRMMGFGFAATYLKPYKDKAERVFSVMPRSMGVYYWPRNGDNLVCLSEEYNLPLETNSVDRIIVIHSLEFSDYVQPTYDELWRVLKSTGRMIVVVPNRMGFWSRAVWSPFGQGTPYSATQVRKLLNAHKFVHERTKKVLYVPPFLRSIFLPFAQVFEVLGQYICPALCGVHMIEVSKQIYAQKGKGVPQPLKLLEHAVQPKPALNPHTSSRLYKERKST